MSKEITKQLHINRKYKSRIFEMLFSNKKELLELYNAINGTNYDNPELLTINTLENAVYMSMHNDISFVIGWKVSLYEHQSTYSPNLPLRFLVYIADLYSVITRDYNLYGTKLVKIPTPKFIIFYNGEQERPEREILKLSAMYETKETEPELELSATLLNINQGYNEGLKSVCKSLKDYSEYTERVRQYAKEMEIEEAVECAITECIKEGILAEFLSKHRAEAKSVSIYEYDEEKHMRMEREESYKAGERDKLRNQVEKKVAKGKSLEEIADALEEEPETIKNIIAELEEK